MRLLLRRAVAKALASRGLSKEDLAYRVLPSFLLDIITKYLRVKCYGLKNIPKTGACIVIANHSGYMGFDALVLSYQIWRATGRVPRIIAHKLWFLHPDIGVTASKFGLVPATLDNGLTYLKKKELLLLFPEGEEGNFKPSRLRYRLRRFRRGFIRLALQTGAPIIPVSVIGAEETHINLSQFRFSKELAGVLVPVPLNVLPLPAKWRIYVGKPIRLKKNLEQAKDMSYVTTLSRHFRRDMQHELHEHLKERKRVFL